ncbi:MAG: hypothetical protein ACD_39C00115G0001, partial [uncultured bacterium]
FSYRIGVGIAAGRIIAGEVGSKESRLDYAMFGDAFKTAEKLEAFTKKFPELPLMVDQVVAEQTAGDLFNWTEEQLDGKPAFRLSEFSESLVNDIKSKEISLFNSARFKNKEQNTSTVEQSWFTRNAALCRKFAYIVGAVSIVFPSLAGLLTMYTTINASEELAKRAIISQCDNARAKLQITDLEPALLEQYFDDVCEKASKAINWSMNGASADELKTKSKWIKQQLDAAGLEQTIFAVLHKPGNNQHVTPDESWRLINYHGKPEFAETFAELLRKLTESSLMGGWPSIAHLKEKMPLILGSNMNLVHIYLDMHARVVQLKVGGVDEYFYWQPILIRDQKKLQQNQMLPRLDLKYADANNYVTNIGAILCMIKRETAQNNHLETLKNMLNREQVKYSVIAENSMTVTDTYPFTGRQFKYADPPPIIDGWHVISSIVSLGSHKYQIYLGKKLTESKVGWPTFLAGLLIMTITLTGLRAWKTAVYLERGIAAKFAWQLWLGLFAAAIVPLTCVYTVNEWFAIDQKELRPVEERLRLLNYYERIERRQFLQERINWYSLQSITRSPELKSAIDNAGSMQTEQQQTEFNGRIDKILKDSEGKKITRYNDMLIFSHRGWQHTYTPPAGTGEEKTEFRRFLDFFVKNLFVELGVGVESAIEQNQSLGAGVKAEITRDSGLEIFRNLFGSDAYFALVNGLDLPITIFMATGYGYLSLMSAPDLVKPETIVFWLFFDNLNTSIQKIFAKVASIYPLFTESMVRYGALKLPQEGGFDPA